MISRTPIRDDIRGGYYLNKKLRNSSPTDYRLAACYYIGDPIKFCMAYFNHEKIGDGYQAELALAGDNFRFNKKTIKKFLALFFENAKVNNTRLYALIPTWNEQAIRLGTLSGFTLEGKLREVARDGDRLVYSMLKREYHGRYIKHSESASSTRPSRHG